MMRTTMIVISIALAAIAACGSSPAGNELDPPDAATSDAAPVDAANVQPALVYAVDVSVWTRTLTDPDVDCLWAEGYRHVIIGTQNLEVTRQQIEIATRGGLTIDLYVYLDWAFPIAP